MPYVSAHVLNTVVAGAEALGVERDALLAELPLTSDILRDPDFRTDVDVAFRLIERARDLSGDPGSGIHHGCQARPELMGVVGHLMLCADDLEHSLKATARFQRLMVEGLRIEPEYRESETIITVCADPDLPRPPPQPVVEWVLASAHCVGESLVHSHFPAARVEFSFPPAVSPAEYERVFHVQAMFEREATRIAYPPEVMSRRIQSADHELFEWLMARARSQSARLPDAGKTVQHRVYRTLVRSFDGERPTLETTARRLAMSTRSLQRHLLEEHTSFQEVLDDARADVARAHLRSGNASVAEVGILLGFTEESAFRKAFRRWTGKAPAEYREAVS